MIVQRHNAFIHSLMFPLHPAYYQCLASLSLYDEVFCWNWTTSVCYYFCFWGSFSSKTPHEVSYQCRTNRALEFYSSGLSCGEIIRYNDNIKSCMEFINRLLWHSYYVHFWTLAAFVVWSHASKIKVLQCQQQYIWHCSIYWQCHIIISISLTIERLLQ